MFENIYAALKPLLKEKIIAPIVFLVLVFLMFTGFLAIKTKPVQAGRFTNGSVCPDGSVKFEVGSGYEYSDGSGTVTIHAESCGHNSASWEPTECYEITDVCIKIGGHGGGSLIDGLSQGGGPFGNNISHVVLTTSYTCEPQECPEEQRCPTECGYPGGKVPDGICGTTDCPATDLCENGPTSTPIPTPTPTLIPPVGGPGPAGPPVCGAATPTAPFLISATAIGGNKVELKWSKVNGASHYTIYYGPSSGNYLYSVPNTGNTDNFIIEGMTGGCYIVRAVDDCAPSEASNEVCTGAVGGAQVLGLSDTSSDLAQAIFFWAGIVTITFGVRLIGKETSGKISA